MLEFLIALLLTIQTDGDPCLLGVDTNWYTWIDQHVQADKVFTYEASEPNIWIYQSDSEIVMFVFKEPIEATVARGEYAAHGRCSRLITVDG